MKKRGVLSWVLEFAGRKKSYYSGSVTLAIFGVAASFVPSVLIAIIMFVTGMGFLGAPLIILAGVIADLIAKSGKYKSFKKQRVAIASAIAADAKLMLFDEPTSGLDYSHMEKVGELLKNLASSGNTVLVATHDPELI